MGRAVDEDLLSRETASALDAVDRTLQATSGAANARLWSLDGVPFTLRE